MMLEKFAKDIMAKSKHAVITGFIPDMEWEDVFQELSMAVWLSEKKFDPKRAGPRTFAIRVMDNKLRDLRRKQVKIIRIRIS